MRIWVDRLTGTWGDAKDLIFVEVDGTDDTIEDINDMTDNDRTDWAITKQKGSA